MSRMIQIQAPVLIPEDVTAAASAALSGTGSGVAAATAAAPVSGVSFASARPADDGMRAVPSEENVFSSATPLPERGTAAETVAKAKGEEGLTTPPVPPELPL